MKKIIYLLSVCGVILIVSFKNNKTTIQDSDSEWKLPTKGGFIYYVFDETLENKKKEICEYLSQTNATSGMIAVNNQIGAKCRELNSQKNNPGSRQGYNLSISLTPTYTRILKGCNPKGNDTLTGQIQIIIPPKIVYPILLNSLKKTTLSQSLKCRLELLLVNKNQYQLKIKGFQMSTMTNSPKGGVDTNEYNLDDVYADFEKSEKKDKEMIRFYKELNYFINSSNKIIKEAIAREIAVQELD